METETIQFASADGRSVVDARLWMPSATAPVAIVQLVHGMAEHIDRYADFAGFLTEAGIGVCAENHIGHGATAPTAEELGHMPPDGKRILIADVHALRTSVQETYAGVPYFLFGHSMGSFITRAYLARHGEGLAGAVICGTGNQPLALSKAGHVLAMLLCHLKGADYRSPLLDSMGAGGFARAIENPRTPLDWISVDPAVVDAYLADEMCGQMFSVGAYTTLTSLTGEVVTLECARRVPLQLPLLFIAGAQDPVGDCGKGVKAAADLARKAGSRDVRLTLYEGMRHEILNEPEKARVYQDVLAWLKEQM